MSASPTPDVTVIIITRNVCAELLECLESVYRHADNLILEVIVVDNASSDASPEEVRRRYPDVQVVALPHNEGDPARNHGLRLARGRARMFLDTDARLTEGALPMLLEALEQTPRAGLVAPQLAYPDLTLQHNIRRFPPVLLPLLRRPPLGRFFEHRRTVRHHLMVDDRHNRRREIEYAISACVLFSARAQAAAGELDEAIWWGWSDADWCFAIREAGFEIIFVPEVTVIHGYRRSTAQRPLSVMALKQLQAHVYFQRKWWSRRRRLLEEGRQMDEEAQAELLTGESPPD
jgi:GT2 family glycosyltransferase